MGLEQKLRRALGSLGNGNGTSVREFLDVWTEKFPEPASNSHRRNRNAWDVRNETNGFRFQTEVSGVRLRGMGCVAVLVLGGDGSSAAPGIRRFMDEVWHGPQMTVVLCATDSVFVEASSILKHGRGVILSRGQVEKMLLSDDPVGELRRSILKQIPFSRLVPFTTSRPAEGVMFFGREAELELLLGQDNTNYAVCGEGQIGKTSLVRQLGWVLRRQFDPRHARTVEADLYNCPVDSDEAAKMIARRISHTHFSHDLTADKLEAFLRRVRGVDSRFRDGPIELVIDEVDDVLLHDKRVGYTLLKELRHAETLGLIRLTIAGRTAPDTIAKDKENPFHQRMKLIQLGPLGTQPASDLFVKPLDDMEVALKDRHAIMSRVLTTCKGHPHRIQDYGWEITNVAAHRRDRSFTVEDLAELEKRLAS